VRRAWLALALAAALGAACGKYGPPVRASAERTPKPTPPPVAAAPAADTEQCPDPNAPGAAETKP